MPARTIKPGVHWVGAIDWDRRLFDGLIPLPQGTSYNSYLVEGSEKTALIDTVDPTKTRDLFDNLDIRGVEKIDYVVANHAEMDHSGSLPKVLERYPAARLLANKKCAELLQDLGMATADRTQVIEDGEAVSLGDKTLKFISAPWVHWPETMFTYLVEDRILFTCDFLGSHFATSRLYSSKAKSYIRAAKVYYAEIMMPYRNRIPKHLDAIDSIRPRIIAPSHGPVHDDPSRILGLYRDWVSDRVDDMVLIPYVTTHGAIERMVNHLSGALIERGVGVKPFNLPVTDVGDLAVESVDAATIVLASPTILTGPHPVVANAAFLVNALRPKTRFASIIGTYGWAGRLIKQLSDMISDLKVELIEPVLVKGQPDESDFRALDALADEIQAKHKTLEG